MDPARVAQQILGNTFVTAVLTDGVAVQRVRHFGRRIPAEVRTALEDSARLPSSPG